MLGRKRLAQFDPNPDKDSALGGKRVMPASNFNVHRAEPSSHPPQQPPFDAHRAQSSQQHVHALNTQFASWVQSQLQNHPDELWEDGVQDYLTHASRIMDEFRDIVAWLKANAAKTKEESMPAFGQCVPDNTSVSGAKNNEIKFQISSKGGVAQVGSHNAENKSKFGLKNNEVNVQVPDRSRIAQVGPNSTDNKSMFSIRHNDLKYQVPEKSGVSQMGSHSTENKSMFGLQNNDLKFQAPDKSGDAQMGSHSTENKPMFGLKNNDLKFQVPDKSGDVQMGSYNAEKSIFGTKNNELKFQLPDNSGAAQAGSTSSFANSWSSSISYKSQTPISFGTQNSRPTSCDASDDPNGEDELEQPSSPSVKKTEEKGVQVVHEVKCKLYVKASDPSDRDAWKDKGMGQLSIKCKEGVSKATKESKPTIIVRNDVGKVLLNALIYPGIKTNLVKNNAIVAIFHTSDDANGSEVVARTYLIRTKTEEERNKLTSTIQEYAPEA